MPNTNNRNSAKRPVQAKAIVRPNASAKVAPIRSARNNAAQKTAGKPVANSRGVQLTLRDLINIRASFFINDRQLMDSVASIPK